MKTPNFILIDDDPVCILLNEMMIKRVFIKYNIQKFTNPELGLKYIKEVYLKNPVETTLLLDINMPQMSGWEVLDTLATYPESGMDHLDVYIVSSSVAATDKEKANTYDAVMGFLEKPVNRYILEKIFTPLPHLG